MYIFLNEIIAVLKSTELTIKHFSPVNKMVVKSREKLLN